jgi:hypothetical protein
MNIFLRLFLRKKTIVGLEKNIDQKRKQVIESELKSLLNDYLSGNLELSDFKSKVDSINKKMIKIPSKK